MAAKRPDLRAEWGREDSNLRRLSRRVYSPFPLAARAHPLETEGHCSLELVEHFDVAVIGAGPAGSVTAYRLSRAGARVLLIDKQRFPRDKPCGGGLTLRAVKELPFSVEPVVEDVVTHVECRLQYGKSFERGGRELCLMTQRIRLDQFLVEQAVAAGAEFRDGTRFDLRSAPATIVVGADGANGTAPRELGLGGEIVSGVALEGNVSHARVNKKKYMGRMVLELGIVPGGYGWVFPKGDHVNVGVGGWASVGPRVRDELRILCERQGIDPADVKDIRGHRLPMRRPGTRLARGKALLVGDSAGLIDPVSGDGMYEAFVSARLATDAIVDVLEGKAANVESYEAELRRTLDPIASGGWGAKVALDKFPRAVFAVMRLPVTWRAVEKIVVGELTAPSAARGAERRALKLVELFARRAGDPGRAYTVAA
jgi:geranylgeranyl reductase family protein